MYKYTFVDNVGVVMTVTAKTLTEAAEIANVAIVESYYSTAIVVTAMGYRLGVHWSRVTE